VPFEVHLVSRLNFQIGRYPGHGNDAIARAAESQGRMCDREGQAESGQPRDEQTGRARKRHKRLH